MQHARIDSKDIRRAVAGFLALAAVAALIILTPAASAQGEKVTICHIPPGNPANAHSITISVSALQTHIDQHGDSIGECGGGDGDCDGPCS
jgi:hypothetical protein